MHSVETIPEWYVPHQCEPSLYGCIPHIKKIPVFFSLSSWSQYTDKITFSLEWGELVGKHEETRPTEAPTKIYPKEVGCVNARCCHLSQDRANVWLL